ncbi:MAG: SDR family NAD(P)-dependent oxidoreductase [Actinomycetota bacterium]|jgi:3-oxoacyl-[acyl-carrier protein] reductase|nr:SDR family NAD(P)-dependent oxidoreductase [Actinomycetota bacterium]
MAMPRPALAGVRAVVTGAAGGIGSTLAAALAGRGAQVHGLDIADVVAAEGEDRVTGVRCDVTDPAAVAAALADAAGPEGVIDIVVAAAGRFPNRPLEQWNLEQFEALWRLNVGGAFNVVREALPYLRRSSAGRVVLVSSSAAHQAVPGFAPYAATKAALIGFARSAAAELGPDGITVNVITPGLTATEAALHGDVAPFFASVVAGQLIRRRLEPDDLAGGVLFLCSPGSAMVTGQVLNIDGGGVTY